MNVTTMRRIDLWLGVPACLVLTWIRYGADLLRSALGRRSVSIRSLLFVKLAEQGATVLAGPAIQRAVQMVGRENVYFLVFAENRFILDVMGLVPAENVITIPTAGLSRSLLGSLAALRRLRRLAPDAAADFEFFARSSAIFTYLSGAGVRVGLHRQGDGAPYRGDLMTVRLKYNPQLHTADTFLSIVDAVVGHTSAAPRTEQPEVAHDPTFHPDEEEQLRVESLLQTTAGRSHYSPLVLLNGNASDLLPLRRWPPDRYVEVAKSLIAHREDIHVAFTGAPNEAAVAEAMVHQVNSPRCFSLAGRTTLRELLVLYCLADLLITNDSGPAHFASLTPIQVITLFGPETPTLFGARTPRAHNIWKNLPCSPCVSAYNNRLTTCTDNQCMQQITVQEVLLLAEELLASGDTSPQRQHGILRTDAGTQRPALPVLSPNRLPASLRGDGE